MLKSREEFSFRIVYVSVLVDTKHSYSRKGFKKCRLETTLSDDNVKTRENVKFSNLVNLILVAYFNVSNCFALFLQQHIWVIMNLALVHDQKRLLHAMVLKTDVTAEQTLQLIILDFFT